MSEESRLGREQIETAYVLKRILDAGVRVHFHLEDRERTLDSPMDKMMLGVQQARTISICLRRRWKRPSWRPSPGSSTRWRSARRSTGPLNLSKKSAAQPRSADERPKRPSEPCGTRKQD